MPKSYFPPSCRRRHYRRIMLHNVGSNFGHEPVKAFAVQFISEFNLFFQRTCVNISNVRSFLIEVLLVFIHPNFGHSFEILQIVEWLNHKSTAKKNECVGGSAFVKPCTRSTVFALSFSSIYAKAFTKEFFGLRQFFWTAPTFDRHEAYRNSCHYPALFIASLRLALRQCGPREERGFFLQTRSKFATTPGIASYCILFLTKEKLRSVNFS